MNESLRGLVHNMEHARRRGISRTSASSSFDVSDLNGLVLMEAATAHNHFFFSTDPMQGNCGAETLIPISPSSSFSHAVDLQGWSFPVSDCLWASHDLLVNTNRSFQPTHLHEAAQPSITRNETEPSFTQDHPSSYHPFGGLDIPYEDNLYGDPIPEGRVHKKEPNCGYLSDEIDDWKDADGKGSQDGRCSQPKTLLSEQRRRNQLNERLYTLRSLVPKITKMDKASLLGDTISYVQDLQKQVKDIRVEIEVLRSNLRGQSKSMPSNMDDAVLSNMVNEMQSYTKENDNGPTPPNKTPTLSTLGVNVSKVEDRMFHIRIHCKKNPGVLVRLMQALESIQLDFHNSNVTSSDGHFIKTGIVKINKPSGLMEEDALRIAILEATFKYGFGST